MLDDHHDVGMIYSVLRVLLLLLTPGFGRPCALGCVSGHIPEPLVAEGSNPLYLISFYSLEFCNAML